MLRRLTASLLYTLLILSTIFTVSPTGFANTIDKEFDVLYEINSNGDAEVVGFTGEGNRITISSKYEGANVVRIADSAFEDCTMLESIIMWADIEEIGDSAFKGCTGLTDFSVPSDTKVIGHHAFEGCSSLETLIVWGDPDIGEYAFANCVNLTAISIGSDTKNVGAHAFEGCTSVTSLIIWGVEIIGDYAFAGCAGIESVSIPSDVLSIGNHAFDGCIALSSVIVWDNDTAIGIDTFANCPKLDNAPSARGIVLECTMSKPDNNDNDKNTETQELTQNENSKSAIRPEVKEALDSYEQFFDEYCEFIKKYGKSNYPVSMLMDYLSFMKSYTETMDKLENMEDDLNDAELTYYMQVTGRITQKLLEVAQ